MNPAFSVVMLTTASGAGYGMLFWLGVLAAAGVMPEQKSFGIPAIFVALALSTAGLLASTLHLGHPERAWRAVSQWRSSWLAREGVLSLLTYLPALGFAAAWGIAGPRTAPTNILGLIAAVLGILTVFSQAMIYATLKPIRQWHNRFVPLNLLLFALASGAACLAAMATFWPGPGARIAAAIGVIASLVAIISKLAYWQFISATPPATTIESATGLTSFGPVRELEWPHTEENYLLREMGYAIGRKHSRPLRLIAVVLGLALPAVLLIAGIITANPASMALFPIAAACSLLGIYVERWLFFAEATHTVTLYYGRAA